jgi:hypothetical protein
MLFFSSLRPVLASAATLVAIVWSPTLRAEGEIYETAAVGTIVSFSASADGNPTPTFKWFKDGVAIPGATNITLTLPNVTATSSGVYNAVATNSAGYAMSNDLVLTVSAVAPEKATAPYFTVQPYPSASAPAGSSMTLSATAAGVPAPTYQWRKNGVSIPSATKSTLTFSSLRPNDNATYSVVATNSAGNATSGNSVLTVLVSQSQALAPVITFQPVSTSVPEYGNAAFKIAATGTPAPTFQWYKNGAAISGATNSYLSLMSVTASDIGTYSVVATNSAGSATSNPASLNVVNSAPTTIAPAITSQPLSQTVNEGGTATFKIAASGTPAPSYQWYKNGVAMPGATNSYLYLASLTANDDANYSVVATNSAGSATSSLARLTVLVPTPSAPAPVVYEPAPTAPAPSSTAPAPSGSAPVITWQPSSQTVAAQGTAAFKIAASGTPAPTYQWYKDGVAVPGATNSWYAISGVTSIHAGVYTVVATNSAGSATSEGATLNVTGN